MASGTQSPPLEATDSHFPMGVSSIDGICSEPKRDVEQRAEYFSDSAKEMYAQRSTVHEPSEEKKETRNE